MEQVSSLVTQKLEAMVEAADRRVLDSKWNAISTLFIYLILEQGQQQRMANAISHALQVSVLWSFVQPYTPMLFCGPNTPPMDSLIIFLSPYIYWDGKYHSKGDVTRWAAAASTVPYTEEVGRDVVSALLQIACCDSLRPHIPIEIWTWMKKYSTLPPLYRGQAIIITSFTVRYIRGLGDIEIIKSFFIVAWSGENTIYDECYMKHLLKEDFCGIGMWGHRKDLVERLDYVLESCDLLGYHSESASYVGLRDVLREVEAEAVKTLIRMLP